MLLDEETFESLGFGNLYEAFLSTGWSERKAEKYKELQASGLGRNKLSPAKAIIRKAQMKVARRRWAQKNREKFNAYMRAYRARKKAEKQ